jgi:hypothetical protein
MKAAPIAEKAQSQGLDAMAAINMWKKLCLSIN